MNLTLGPRTILARTTICKRVSAIRDSYILKDERKSEVRYLELKKLGDRILKKFSDHKDYVMWNVIAVGTTDVSLPQFDFPGEYSVVRFLKSLEK